jgi:CHAT domain-containing protein
MIKYALTSTIQWLLIAGLLSSARIGPISAGEPLARSSPDQGQGIENAPVPELTDEQQIYALLQSATTHQARGRVSETFADLRQALTISQAFGDKRLRSLVLGRLSDGYLLLRQADHAEHLARTSLELARSQGDGAAQANALNHLGNALMAAQLPDSALQAYRDAIKLADGTHDSALMPQLMINAIHALLVLGREPEAVPLIESALEKVRSRPSDENKAADLIALGHLAQRSGDAHPPVGPQLHGYAYTAFTEALALAEHFKDPKNQSYATGHLGELYLADGRYAEADRLFQRAIFFAQQIDAPELLARWYWKSGQAKLAEGQEETAEKAYRTAIAYLEEIQYALVFGFRGHPLAFRDSIGAVYLELAGMLLQKAESQSDQDRRLKLLHEVRAVMEEFKTVELENHFKDGCVSARRHDGLMLDPEARLGSHVAVIYTIVFPDRVALLTSFSDGSLELAQASVPRERLRETANEFLHSLTRSGNPRRLLKYGRALHHWLIDPVHKYLGARNIDTLVLVPDDVLLTIPLAALHDGQGFLVERYAMVVTPGLSLTAAARTPTPGSKVLLNGLSQAVGGFSPLPHVRDELQKVADLVANDRLLDSEFRRSNVHSKILQSEYAVVLFATHGRFLSDPDQSFLLAYDDKIRLNELEQLVDQGETPLDLLVLSACETAEGDERAALGLAGVAVQAGVNSVIASLWSVSDESTSELIPDFFSNLKTPGTSKAEALRLSQNKLLASDRFNHPFYWAPFILVGNWN